MPSIDAAVAEFQERVTGLEIVGPMRFPILDLRDKGHACYKPWSTSSGVYFFESGGETQYIGRALPGTGLRARVHNQCTSFGDPKWDLVIKDDTAIVGIVTVPSNGWYWAAALEAFLIAALKPFYNKRSS